LKVLGPYAGPIACVAVALACLTTAIALACIFAEFVHYDLTMGKVGYIPALIITLFISYFISVLNFVEIVKFLTPILHILYPALIVLCILNMAYKLFRFQPILIPFCLTLLLSLAGYFL
jgi:LIVCS family branched-chain amino acid:cation transporter